MGAGAIAGLQDEKQMMADDVGAFLGENWWAMWKTLDTADAGFVKCTALRQWFIDNAGTEFGGKPAFWKVLIGADGVFKEKVFRRAFMHVTIRDPSHDNVNIYDYEFRRLCRNVILANQLADLAGETEAEAKNLTKEEFVACCKALFADSIDEATYDRAFKNIDDLGGNKWANELVEFNEFTHYVITVMDA